MIYNLTLMLFWLFLLFYGLPRDRLKSVVYAFANESSHIKQTSRNLRDECILCAILGNGIQQLCAGWYSLLDHESKIKTNHTMFTGLVECIGGRSPKMSH